MVIDNVRIINTDSLNLDMEPKEDDYIPEGSDTPVITDNKGSIFNWLTYTLIGITVVSIGACVTLFVMKKGGKKS